MLFILACCMVSQRETNLCMIIFLHEHFTSCFLLITQLPVLVCSKIQAMARFQYAEFHATPVSCKHHKLSFSCRRLWRMSSSIQHMLVKVGLRYGAETGLPWSETRWTLWQFLCDIITFYKFIRRLSFEQKQSFR